MQETGFLFVLAHTVFHHPIPFVEHHFVTLGNSLNEVIAMGQQVTSQLIFVCMYISDLFQYLEGMKIGEEREFDIVFPDNWEPPLYRGLSARVSTNMRELFEWELPEFNDDFIQTIDKSTKLTAEDFKIELVKGAKTKLV